MGYSLIEYHCAPGSFSVDLPLSKSIANRSLVINHLAGNHVFYSEEGLPDDVVVMQSALREVCMAANAGSTVVVDCGQAGTVARFLLPFLAVQQGDFLLTASERLQQRPFDGLKSALRQLGATILELGPSGWPLFVRGSQLTGRVIDIEASTSSQFVSALLMVGPCLLNGLQLRLLGTPVSEPYIQMTIALMQQAGACVERTGNIVQVKPGGYSGFELPTDRDWSAAAPWFEFATLVPGVSISLPGLAFNHLQGDEALCSLFGDLGVEITTYKDIISLRRTSNPKPVQSVLDFSAFPDLAQCYLATLVGLNYGQMLTGLKTLRWKETDRIDGMLRNIELLGGCLKEIEPDSISTATHCNLKPASLSMLDDHRMAFALIPLAVVTRYLIVDDPNVVSKSYPRFIEHIKMAGFSVKDIESLPYHSIE